MLSLLSIYKIVVEYKLKSDNMNIKGWEDCHSQQQIVALSISPDKMSTTDDTVIQWDNHKDDKRWDFYHSGAHKQVDNT